MDTTQIHIAIFASGGGSNAASIIDYFRKHESIEVSFLLTDNPAAGVLGVAQSNNIESHVAEPSLRTDGKAMMNLLASKKINFIALAGYLKKVNPMVTKAYSGRMVNIHPALLPKFGGKGMYGMHVHRAVIESGERTSGPTIHYVNEDYDDGAIIKQVQCDVEDNDTPESLQKRVLKLEHHHYPRVIEAVCLELIETKK